MSEQDDTPIYGLEGANYAAGYAEGEQERDRLQSELDRLRQDVEPVLRAAERAVLRFERNDRGGLWERNDLGGLWTILRLLEGELIAFRQQHPKEGNDG